jgi:superfamily II DNA or RNA helicase
VVADEVHNAGQPRFASFLERIDAAARLGLSATPQRYGDAEGTERIYTYFGQALLPSFTLADAIESGVLVHYQYDYETAALSFIEQGQYDVLTEKIRNLSRMESDNDRSISDALRMLLIRRSRIVKKAEEKTQIAARVIAANWEHGDRWLVYCSDQEQVADVKKRLQDLGRDQVIEYHQNMVGSRTATIDFFSDRSAILLAIKCLDEGVNIPAVNKAVILASSTNPREYIQRRGRLLRSSPGKERAHIWDCMVRGSSGAIISENELIRGIEFAKSSDSPATFLNLQREAREGGYKAIDFEDESPDGEDSVSE